MNCVPDSGTQGKEENMTVRSFLKLHEGGVACVSIHQKPYNWEKHRYVDTYFEEDNQEDILESDTFERIADKEVDHFCVIGGGLEPVELCIYLEEEA